MYQHIIAIISSSRYGVSNLESRNILSLFCLLNSSWTFYGRRWLHLQSKYFYNRNFFFFLVICVNYFEFQNALIFWMFREAMLSCSILKVTVPSTSCSNCCLLLGVIDVHIAKQSIHHKDSITLFYNYPIFVWYLHSSRSFVALSGSVYSKWIFCQWSP